ncbi:MAG: Rha family transcriptional regulator [Methylovulum sp.]|nr:Rha family transcriptional regulator [Methylovulum sp.]
MGDLQMFASVNLTMSSREIAELVQSRHDDVKRSIERLAERGVIELPPLAEIKTATKPFTIYKICKRDSYVIVAQLSPEFTAKLVDRWQELENSQTAKFSLPEFTNPAEAAIAWAEQYKAKELAQATVKKQQQTIKHKDDLILASNEASIKAGEILIREFVKSNDIIDLGEKQFYAWMRQQNIVSDKNEPYQPYIKSGYFTYKPTEKAHGGEFRYTLRVTPRGKVWLAAKYMAYLDTQGFAEFGSGEAA